MFPLVESSRTIALRQGWSGRTASVALHATLLAAALVLTRHPAARPPDIRVSARVIWSDEPLPVRAAPTTPGVAVPARPVFILPGTLAAPVPNVPVVGLPSPGADPAPGPVIAGPALPGGAGTAPDPSRPADAAAVDELPVLLAHPAIRYPELARQAGVQGTVVVEAVLDTLGGVEPGSAQVVRSDNALFDAEARAVVAGSRYRPARLGGRAVRVRIQVPVAFAIRR